MALYHNLSCTKSNLGRRAENSFLWALSYPNLFFLHILLSHPFKHLCKKGQENCSCRWRLPCASFGSAVSVTQVWGQPGRQPWHRSTAMAPLTAGPAQPPGAPSSCTLQTGCEGSPTDFGCSREGTTAGCTPGSISGAGFFFAEENFDL